jgi:catecholate siderophore receptor
MSTIKSRKHAAPTLLGTTALALLAGSLPSLALAAESAQAPRKAEEQVLPTLKATATAESGFKADTSANAKLTQPLLDTPKTVQVIKREMLQEQGAASLMEALRNTPGITMQLGENGATAAGDTFQMRGFSTQSATFVDGMRDLGAITRDTFNLESVEVVKGPSGADIGRGASAGYINLISKQPQADQFNELNVSLGTASRKRATLDSNVQLSPSTAARVNLMLQDGGVEGRDVVKNKSRGIAPSIAFGLNTPTRVFLYSQHVRQDNVPDGGIPTTGMPGFYNADAKIQAADKVRRENFYGSSADFEKVDADMFSARLEMDLGGARLTNLTRYGRTHMDRVLTGVNGLSFNATKQALEVARTRQRVDQRNEILGNQTNLVTSFKLGGLQHDLSAGAELLLETQGNRGFTSGSTSTVDVVLAKVKVPSIALPNANLYAPSAADVLGMPIATGADTDGRSLTKALYAFDTLHLSEQLKLSGGLRVEHYSLRTTGSTLVTGGSGGNLATYKPLGYDVGSFVPVNLSSSDWLKSWNLGLVYKPVAEGTLYVSAANSYTPPGGENFVLSSSATSQANATLDPQKTSNVELGAKWELLERRLNVSAALYQTRNEGQISYDDLKNPVAMGKTRVTGVELSAVGQITNFWQVSAGVARMKTKQSDQWSSDRLTETTGVRWSPDWTATVWTSYTFGDLTVGGGVRHVSEQKRAITTATAAQNMPAIPAYTVTDLMAAYAWSKTLKFQLNVGNLFDKTYIASLNNSGARMKLGAERSLTVSANLLF